MTENNFYPTSSEELRTLSSKFDDILSKNEALLSENAQLKSELNNEQIRILYLQEQINLLLSKKYGRSSEPFDQPSLFDEAEISTSDEPEIEDETTVPEHKRKKTSGRKPLPADLPRVDVIHDLTDAEKKCPNDGEPLVEIGRDISEQLDIIPAKIQVIRHIRIKYGCALCEQTIKIASLPPQPLPKSMASPGTLAYIAIAKYQDALPLYRQETILHRIGVDIPRSTLANWMIKSGELITPLLNLLRDQLLSYDIIQMDETTIQVLKEPEKEATTKSYMWVQRGGPPGQPIVLFDYDPSRSQKVPIKLLADYQGYLQTDGYNGYAAVQAWPGVSALCCWAHARRKFNDAVRALGKKGKAKTGKATKGLNMIQKLYRIEREYKNATPEQRYQARQEQAKPLIDEMREWLDQSLLQIPPKSYCGKALTYLDNQWQLLIIYLNDGRLNIDNNLAENAIRPFVIGRKNWLFSNSVKGANASANLYSLIETAKLNGLEPYSYLRHIFKELPQSSTVEQIESLLPWNVGNI